MWHCVKSSEPFEYSCSFFEDIKIKIYCCLVYFEPQKNLRGFFTTIIKHATLSYTTFKNANKFVIFLFNW